jgi:hypothetical protein
MHQLIVLDELLGKHNAAICSKRVYYDASDELEGSLHLSGSFLLIALFLII